MKRILVLIVLLSASVLVFAGGQGEGEAAEKTETADAVTGPTKAIVTNESELQQAIGPEGPWIIIFEEDMQVPDELVVSGEVYEEMGAEEPRRKFALYAQDADRNVTARYTLTAPRLVVRHPNTRIQGGTFAGDVYVEAEGFELVDASIDGNLYFASEELQKSAEIGDQATVTGETAVRGM